MKKKEDNSFQLLFTALVLVVIAVGGTLAWFAHNTTSSVDQMAASITSPTDNSSFDSADLYYLENGYYVEYDEGAVTYVPGMKKLFRVRVDQSRAQAIMFVLEDDPAPSLCSAMKISFHDQYNNSWTSEEYFPTPTSTITSLAQAGQYGLTITHNIQTHGSDYIYFVIYIDPS